MHVGDAPLPVVPSVCGMFADSSLLVKVTCCCVFRSPLDVIHWLQFVALSFASFVLYSRGLHLSPLHPPFLTCLTARLCRKPPWRRWHLPLQALPLALPLLKLLLTRLPL